VIFHRNRNKNTDGLQVDQSELGQNTRVNQAPNQRMDRPGISKLDAYQTSKAALPPLQKLAPTVLVVCPISFCANDMHIHLVLLGLQ
jgi:hypothetical protein